MKHNPAIHRTVKKLTLFDGPVIFNVRLFNVLQRNL